MKSQILLSDLVCKIDQEFDEKVTENKYVDYLKVCEARRKSDNLSVLIKYYDESDQKGFMREIELLDSIHHPGCQKLIAFSLRPSLALVTELPVNGDLMTNLQKTYENPSFLTVFTPTKMMCCLYRICSIMDFLHSHDIMHRNLKPQVFYLDDNYEVTLNSFFLSRQGDLNLTLANIGTPLYMAPEIFTDEYECYTSSIDVYSFSVLFYNFFGKVDNLDDKKGRLKSPQNLMMRLSRGARFVKPEKMSQEQYELYLKCASMVPYNRPTFKQLVDIFESDSRVFIDGTNETEYKEYINKCKEEKRSSWVH